MFAHRRGEVVVGFCPFLLASVMTLSLSSHQSAGELDKVQSVQRKSWLWSHVDHQLMARFRDWPGMTALAASVEEKVAEGAMAPGTAADLLLDHFFDSTHRQ